MEIQHIGIETGLENTSVRFETRGPSYVGFSYIPESLARVYGEKGHV
jgi:hypothetical protein